MAKTKVIQIRLDETSHSLFQLACNFSGATMTDVLTKAISDYIDSTMSEEIIESHHYIKHNGELMNVDDEVCSYYLQEVFNNKAHKWYKETKF